MGSLQRIISAALRINSRRMRIKQRPVGNDALPQATEVRATEGRERDRESFESKLKVKPNTIMGDEWVVPPAPEYHGQLERKISLSSGITYKLK